MDRDYYKKYEPIFNSWYIKDMLGAGSFGKVFLIERQDFGDTYQAALKAITIPQNQGEIESARADGMDDASVTSYFRQITEEVISEFVLMSKLKGNSNIVSYEDHVVMKHQGQIGWDILIRMELLTSLTKHVTNNKLTQNDVVKLGIDMCRALELCQKRSIIHRDIKPENIFISNDGDFKLGDFGIARTIEKTTGNLSKKGTSTYMAPEIYLGKEYGSSVDIYSLGIVMYWLLNENRTPFLPAYPAKINYSDKETALLKRVRGDKIPAPSKADIRLAEIVLKMCAFDPKERYDSVALLKMDLESLLHSEKYESDVINIANMDSPIDETSDYTRVIRPMDGNEVDNSERFDETVSLATGNTDFDGTVSLINENTDLNITVSLINENEIAENTENFIEQTTNIDEIKTIVEEVVDMIDEETIVELPSFEISNTEISDDEQVNIETLNAGISNVEISSIEVESLEISDIKILKNKRVIIVAGLATSLILVFIIIFVFLNKGSMNVPRNVVSNTNNTVKDEGKNNNEVKTPLTQNSVADKSTLKSEIEAKQGNNEETYTEESWKLFAEALQEAKSVNENTNASQDEVDKAVDNLKVKFYALEEKKVEEITLTNLEYTEKIDLTVEGKDTTIEITGSYSDGTTKNLTKELELDIADKNIATISEDGVIKAKKAGSTIIISKNSVYSELFKGISINVASTDKGKITSTNQPSKKTTQIPATVNNSKIYDRAFALGKIDGTEWGNKKGIVDTTKTGQENGAKDGQNRSYNENIDDSLINKEVDTNGKKTHESDSDYNKDEFKKGYDAGYNESYLASYISSYKENYKKVYDKFYNLGYIKSIKMNATTIKLYDTSINLKDIIGKNKSFIYGEVDKITDIKTNDLIEIMTENGTVFIRVTRQKINGKVSSVQNDQVGVSGTLYNVNKKCFSNIDITFVLGTEGNFYLDGDGYIAVFKKID